MEQFIIFDKTAEKPYINEDGNNCNFKESAIIFDSHNDAEDFAKSISPKNFLGELEVDWFVIESL